MAEFATTGIYPSFPRSGDPNRQTTHYCPGCGHGIIAKLIAEAVHDLGLEDRVIYVDPVGCAVFAYYYLDGAHVSAAHGRAQAVATGISRVRPDAVPIVMQGDGDLGAIGFNHAFQAANRGERMTVIFINNTLYGMTGGQMSPTTLCGQRTATTPFGRDPLTCGYPLHMAELVATLRAPIYSARTSVADAKRIHETRSAIRKAIALQQERRAYAFLEILSPCPTNCRMTPADAADYWRDTVEAEYPLGVFKES